MLDHPLMQAYIAYEAVCRQSKENIQNSRKEFGQKLRESRKQMGKTVREVGEILGTTGSFINQIETQHRSILKRYQVERLIEICYNAANRSEQKVDSNLGAVG